MSSVILICVGLALVGASIGSYGLYAVRLRLPQPQQEPRRLQQFVLTFLTAGFGMLGVFFLLPDSWRWNSLALTVSTTAMLVIFSLIEYRVERSRLGATLVELNSASTLMFFWIVLPLAAVEGLFELIADGVGDEGRLIVVVCLSTGLLIAGGVATGFSRTLIGENGVATVEGLVRWSDISRYIWEGDTLTIESNADRPLAWRQTTVRVPADWIPEVRRVLRERVLWRPPRIEPTATAEPVPDIPETPDVPDAPIARGQPSPLWSVLWLAGMVVVLPATLIARAVRETQNEV